MVLRVLIVEDEPEMAALLARGLQSEGYAVDVAENGIDGMSLSATEPYDIAVLDVMLPGMSGFELCRRLREQTSGIAILLLTARDAVDDRIRGLDAGADDYLTKPFAFAELAARLRALRRRDAIGAARLDVGDLRIDLVGHRISVEDRELRLSRTEFDLLRLLAENADRVLQRAEILDAIWGSASYIDQNIVDQYVSYVRRKLDAVGATARIVTARGVGFTLVGAPP
jgi:DNA-binding response OmpR family regulator